MSTKLYIEFVENAIKTEGINVADTANKLALEMKKISLDQYRKAAQIIVNAYLAEIN